ncbi:TetR/AcrR family transcriptional regulator [Bradyrhizobium commune]|uniref:TetR/AcrR family transcriptional regulator n=2 Tax=Bradyrhizobium commune TaxID=83627 RepID=A0A7S9DEG4_9BRAD|nr:TetR/AcrR family transcriptional regulator [Bradyrhizobium commune]
MPRKTDARARAIATAERLFRIQGYAATGLNQIIEESGSPKGSFYFHFPRGKTQLAEETIDPYLAKRAAAFRHVSANTTGDAPNFFSQIFAAIAAEMIADDFQYGCLMQNLANELSPLDTELTKRLALGFAHLTEIIAEHLRGCGFAPARASGSAAALVAAIEGGRTIARVERAPAIFGALADIFAKGARDLPPKKRTRSGTRSAASNGRGRVSAGRAGRQIARLRETE